jgi:hypothetical protein
MPEIAEAAVTEPVESVESVETVETEPVETESGSETVDNVDSSVEKPELTDKTTGKGKINLADVVKKSADALKAINPALPAALRAAEFEQSRLYKEFPDGLKEAVALKTTISEYGGIEGIKETTESLAGIQPALKNFFDGKPEFIDALAEESPSSFSQIMPAGLAKWKAVDGESYNHHLAQVMTQTLDSSRVQETLASIWNSLDPEKAKPARDAIDSIWTLLDGLRKAGEKVPERKVDPQNEALTRREQELAERETKAMLSPIANEGRQQIQSITDREMNASYQWTATDPDVQSAVRDRVRQEVINASGKDKGFSREFDRLKDRGDSAGLSRHVKNFQERVTPSIVQRVAKLFAVKPKAAGNGVVKAKPAIVNGNGAAKQDPGWIRISAMPKPQDIDRRKTTDTMILNNQAIDKNGRKITWN